MFGDVKDKLKEFTTSTSIHGLSHMYGLSSKLPRLLWSCICYAVFGLFLCVVTLYVKQFFEYSTSVKTEEVPNGFTAPLITVCNHGHISVVVLQEMVELIDDGQLENEQSVTGFNDSDADVLEFFNAVQYLKRLETYFNYIYSCNNSVCQKIISTISKYPSLLRKFSVTREAVFSQLKKQTLDKIGERLHEFFMSCFNGISECNLNYTKVTSDPFYYKCYTYDPQEGKNPHEAIREGVDNGITFVFLSGSKMINPYFIPGFDNSLKQTGGTDGIRLVIHPPETKANPLNQGVDISIGTSVVLGIAEQDTVRLEKPYGICTSKDVEFSQLLDSLTDNDTEKRETLERWNNTFIYDTDTCKMFCRQKQTWSKCACLDPKLPSPLDSFGNQHLCHYVIDDLKSACYGTNVSRDCLKSYEKFANDAVCLSQVRKTCDWYEKCKCPPACRQTQYQTSYSVSAWPAEGPELSYAYDRIVLQKAIPYFKSLKTEVAEHVINYLDCKKNNKSQKEVMSNFIKVTLYYQSLSVTVTSQIKVYSVIDVLSDVGGLMGLCMGLSVISLFEIFSLVFSILQVFLFKGKNKVSKFDIRDT